MPILYVFMSLVQLHLHDYLVFTCLTRDDATLNRFAIYDDLLHTLLFALWVFHGDMILAATELAGYLILLGRAWQARVDIQALVVWFDAQDELAHGVPHPCGCTRQP